MAYRKFFPCELLRPYIESYTISETDVATAYPVLPDTNVVMGFQYRGRLSMLESGVETRLSISGVTGLRDRYRIFRNAENTGTVLVIFRAGGASAFFKQPIHEIFRESLSLDNFMLRSELLAFEESLFEAKADAVRIKIVEQFLIARLRPVKTDTLIIAALALIHKSKGKILIRDLLRELHTSQSPLEKRFRQVVGTSPKKFASIVRFKHILQNYTADRSLTALGYEAGFYDQAHFIKEFKGFTGQTPERFFKK